MSKKTFIKSSYDLTAEKYDQRYQRIQKIKYKNRLYKLGEDDLILDVGCGTGLILEDERIVNKRYIGLDFSHAMIKKAKTRIHRFKELIIADSEKIPLRDRVFQTIVSYTMLQNLESDTLFLKEVKRITRIKGKIILSTLKKVFNYKIFKKELEANNMKLTNIINLNNIEDVILEIINT
ncbi:MAG: class I SAM-dependent methyltransferase [Candidatus Odinarchaeia archaeon]